MSTPNSTCKQSNHPSVRMVRLLIAVKEVAKAIESDVIEINESASACAAIDRRAELAIRWLAEIRSIAIEQGERVQIHSADPGNPAGIDPELLACFDESTHPKRGDS